MKGTEILGFFLKDTAWLRIDISTALRDYGLLRKFTAFFATVGFVHRVFFVHRLSQINTDFLISKDILIITDYYHLIRAFGS